MNFEEVKQRYRDRNIDAFLKRLFPFGDSENACIAEEVLRLCELVQQQYRREFLEIEWLEKQAKNRTATPAVKANDVLQLTEGQLKEFYLPAFLMSILNRTSYDQSKFEQYKALTLLSVTRLSFIGTHESKIKDICDDIRLFSQGKRENLAAYMPDIHILSFPLLVAAFQNLVAKDNDDLPPSHIVNELNHYRRPFEASYKFTEGFHRKVTTSQFRKRSRLDISPIKTLDDEGDDSLIELREIKARPSNEQYEWQKEDCSNEINRTVNVVTSNAYSHGSYASNALRARAIQSRIHRKEMSLPCDIASMTNFEVGTLISYCVNQISHKSKDSESVMAILMMLFTGTALAQVKKLSTKKSRRKQVIGFSRKHRIPSQTQRDELLPLITQVQERLWFPLPRFLCKNLRSFRFSKITEDDLKPLIQHINKKHGTHITLTKISNVMSQVLTLGNIDPTIIALIKGTAIQEVPALFYTQLKFHQVLSYYQRYLKFLSNFTGDTVSFTQCDELPDDVDIGSTLRVNTDLLSLLFFLLRSKIDMSKKKDGFSSQEVHNLITLYTQLVMSLASGYRPVTGWFGKREHIYLANGDYWISDKESGSGDNSRVVSLPDIAIQTLTSYLSFCEKMSTIHGNANIAVSQRYQAVLSSREHLFFYRSKDKTIECSPSTYSEYVDPIFPLQPNWPRHHIRSILQEKEIEPSLIAAWMGHQHQTKMAYHSHSQLNRKHMLQIASTIDNHLSQLGIEVAPWD